MQRAAVEQRSNSGRTAVEQRSNSGRTAVEQRAYGGRGQPAAPGAVAGSAPRPMRPRRVPWWPIHTPVPWWPIHTPVPWWLAKARTRPPTRLTHATTHATTHVRTDAYFRARLRARALAANPRAFARRHFPSPPRTHARTHVAALLDGAVILCFYDDTRRSYRLQHNRTYCLPPSCLSSASSPLHHSPCRRMVLFPALSCPFRPFPPFPALSRSFPLVPALSFSFFPPRLHHALPTWQLYSHLNRTSRLA